MKSFAWLFVAGMVLVSGCAMFKDEPDVVLWKSKSIPAEWAERQVKNVSPASGVRVLEVGTAPQFNESGRGAAARGFENFLVAAAYNKCTGAFSAEWGYAPNPEHGHNGVKLDFDPTGSFRKTGMCFGKHPVCYEFSPDFSTLTMLWGARFENRGQSAHRVGWKVAEQQ